MKTRKIKFIAKVCRWFDRINGNTYHSVKIIRCKDNKTIYCPFQYGYDSAYENTTLQDMLKARWLPRKYNETNYWLYQRENNYPILFDVQDGLKRDCVNNGRE